MLFSVRVNADKSFGALQGQTLWSAAANSGLTIPYSCRNGRCSSCKCKVISGESEALHPEIGLTFKEKAEGWILSCVRSASTDLELQVENIDEYVLPSTVTVPCRIHSTDYLSSDVLRVVLRLPPSTEFNYLPGQYIDVIGPASVRRSYSLANANVLDKKLELHIRAVSGGLMSKYWFDQAKANDLLRLIGPLGTFFLRETKDLDVVFLATGTGLAPVKSMLESMALLGVDKLPRSVTVIWGGRLPQDLYCDLSSIAVNHRYVPVLSRAGPGWAGARGYVQRVLLSLELDLRNVAVYACGSYTMIQSAKAELTKAGLPDKRFYSDAFVPSGT
jgi:CDP-4-dehydro-6-deoxyglucose reductase